MFDESSCLLRKDELHSALTFAKFESFRLILTFFGICSLLASYELVLILDWFQILYDVPV